MKVPVKETKWIFLFWVSENYWCERGLLQKPLLRFYCVKISSRPLPVCYLFKFCYVAAHPFGLNADDGYFLVGLFVWVFFNFPPWMTFSGYSLCGTCMAAQQNCLETRSWNWETATVLKLLLQVFASGLVHWFSRFWLWRDWYLFSFSKTWRQHWFPRLDS